MSFENNNTEEVIDNEKINAEWIEKYLDSFEWKSEKFIEDRENVLKALNYSERYRNFDIQSEIEGNQDVDLLFKDWKYYIKYEYEYEYEYEYGLESNNWYTAKEFIEKFWEKEEPFLEAWEAILKAWKEYFKTMFWWKEWNEEDTYTTIMNEIVMI